MNTLKNMSFGDYFVLAALERQEGRAACEAGEVPTGNESESFKAGYGDQYAIEAAQDKGFN